MFHLVKHIQLSKSALLVASTRAPCVTSPVKVVRFHTTQLLRSPTSPNPTGKKTEMDFSAFGPSKEFLERSNKSYIDKFASKSGKTGFSAKAINVFVLTVAFCVIAPMTIFRRKIVQFYEHEETRFKRIVPKTSLERTQAEIEAQTYFLGATSQNLLDQVMDDFQLSAKQRDNVGPFTSDTFDALTYGNADAFYGLSIGIPAYFEYTSIDQVKPDEVKFKPIFSLVSNTLSLSDIDEATVDAAEWEKLKSTFVLSEKAKKFGIAQKLLASRGTLFTFTDILPLPLFALLGTIFMAQLNDSLNMFSRPFYVRLALYAAYYSSGIMFVMFALSASESEMYDFNDRQAYSLNHDYLEGGIEFYSKAVERGQLLRELHPRGKFYFDEEGDPTRYFFQPPFLTSSRALGRLKKAEALKAEGVPVPFGQSLFDKLKGFLR